MRVHHYFVLAALVTGTAAALSVATAAAQSRDPFDDIPYAGKVASKPLRFCGAVNGEFIQVSLETRWEGTPLRERLYCSVVQFLPDKPPFSTGSYVNSEEECSDTADDVCEAITLPMSDPNNILHWIA